jgi:thiamine phosphate synthase YjbQ (UPF0047 family)
MPFNLL